MLKLLFFAALAYLLLATALKLLFPLPSRSDIVDDTPVPLAAASHPEIERLSAQAPAGESGVMLLDTGLEAVAARLAIIRQAQSTIDAQYYIWEDDLSGRIMLAEIIAAADRGVRVRILIDDNPTSGLDPMWAAANSHPNISVRIFNPLTIRAVRPANYLFDFPRLNRRMHNKSLTVDGVITVVGGRNVGDVYFGAAEEGLFIDLDALAIGTVVPQVSAEFQRYWASEPVFPAEMILPPVPPTLIADYRRPRFDDVARACDYYASTQRMEAQLSSDAQAGQFLFAPIDLLVDSPDKGLGTARREDLMATDLGRILQHATRSIDLVSGYFVPTDVGVDMLSDIARRGVAMRVVTNGIAVTDVPLVHAGYVPSRKPLLEAGVALFEARQQPRSTARERDLGMMRFSGGGESVHAKTFAIDGQQLFVGSFNFDPRSAVLNSEMGFLIHSPQLAAALGQALDRNLAREAYALSLNDRGDLVWSQGGADAPQATATEPGTTATSRAMVWVMSKLPIAWLL